MRRLVDAVGLGGEVGRRGAVIGRFATASAPDRAARFADVPAGLAHPRGATSSPYGGWVLIWDGVTGSIDATDLSPAARFDDESMHDYCL